MGGLNSTPVNWAGWRETVNEEQPRRWQRDPVTPRTPRARRGSPHIFTTPAPHSACAPHQQQPPQTSPQGSPSCLPQAAALGRRRLRGSQWSHNPRKNPISTGRERTCRLPGTSPAPLGALSPALSPWQGGRIPSQQDGVDPGPPNLPSLVSCSRGYTRAGPPRGQRG